MDFETIKDRQKWRVEISPVTGRPRFIAENNDVIFYIEKLRGIQSVCKLFSVNEETVHLWIDESPIPQPYADKVCQMTGASLKVIQEARSYVYDDREVWPPIRSASLPKELGLPQVAADGKTFLPPVRFRRAKV